MSFEVNFYRSLGSANGTFVQVPSGLISTIAISPVTPPAGAALMRIHPKGGSVTLTYAEGTTEYFDAPEFRQAPTAPFTVA